MTVITYKKKNRHIKNMFFLIFEVENISKLQIGSQPFVLYGVIGSDFVSDHIVKIIPQDPFYQIPELTLNSTKTYLESQISCDFIETESNETPVFVDCGSNLEKISCPECGTELDFDWWGEAMDRAAETAFTSLNSEMPCCKKIVSLNDINYYFPCGFSQCLISIFNPKHTIEDKIIDAVQNILGSNVRIIEAHI